MTLDTKLRSAAAAALAVALSLVVATPGYAAHLRYGDTGAPHRGLYDYVPRGGADYQSRNGTPYGPPDPATCGGYSC